MNVVNEEDAVGYYMHITLINDVKMEGVIFTYNPKEGLIVIIEKKGDQQNIKMVRTSFIKEFKVVKPTSEQMLPEQLDSFRLLPSMQAGRDKSIFKHASVQLKQAESDRMKYLDMVDGDTSIAACDAFVRLARLYPDIAWDNEEQTIRVTNHVVVIGDPDWTNPKAMLVNGAPDKEKSMVDRIQKALAVSKK